MDDTDTIHYNYENNQDSSIVLIDLARYSMHPSVRSGLTLYTVCMPITEPFRCTLS